MPDIGRLYGIGFLWSSNDTEQGMQWKEKIAHLSTAPVVMNTVAPTTTPEVMAGNAGLIPATM